MLLDTITDRDNDQQCDRNPDPDSVGNARYPLSGCDAQFLARQAGHARVCDQYQESQAQSRTDPGTCGHYA